MSKIEVKTLKTDLVLYATLTLFIIFDIFHFTSIRIGPDSGYYLGVARDWWVNGNIPLIDTHSRYTPLGYLFYMIPYFFEESPTIQAFLMLNLVFFVFSALIFLRILKNEIQNTNYLLLIFISFLFTFHGITHDIKLENLVLFFNTLILYQISKVNPNISDDANFNVQSVLIGFLGILAFLTKQFAGLSILLSVLLFHIKGFKGLRLFRIILVIGGVFLIGVLGYVLLNVQLGQSLEHTLTQIKGNLIFSCVDSGSGGGRVYGERRLINLLVAFKYYRLNLLFIFVFFILLINLPRRKQSITLKNIGVLLLFIGLVQIPFYFQIFPHYIHFGIPFVFYLVILYLKNTPYELFTQNINLSKVALLLTILLCCYSFWQNGKIHELKMKQYLANDRFHEEINNKIPRGSKAFMINNRRLYYTCGFRTPVPKTLGYAFVGLDCLKNSINSEKPLEFWLADIHDISNAKISGYTKLDSFDIVMDQNRMYAAYFKKLNN
jgi:hypothetical protein